MDRHEKICNVLSREEMQRISESTGLQVILR